MNAFLMILTDGIQVTSGEDLKTRLRMISVFGEAAEIFEESLTPFLPKILLYFQRILKELQPAFHEPLAEALKKLMTHVVDLGSNDVLQLIRMVVANFSSPNSVLHVGSALCLHSLLAAKTYSHEEASAELVKLLLMKHCKAVSQLLSCLRLVSEKIAKVETIVDLFDSPHAEARLHSIMTLGSLLT